MWNNRDIDLTINSGSMCSINSLDTGISPDGSVSFVLSTYIGLNYSNNIYKS